MSAIWRQTASYPFLSAFEHLYVRRAADAGVSLPAVMISVKWHEKAPDHDDWLCDFKRSYQCYRYTLPDPTLYIYFAIHRGVSVVFEANQLLSIWWRKNWHCEILAYPYILCVLSKNGRETPVSGIHVTCIHPDARCDSACEGSEVVTLLSDSETRHYENYFYRLASHEKLISNIRVAPRQARKWFNWI